MTKDQETALRAVQGKALDTAIDNLTWLRNRLRYRRLTKAQRRAAANRLAETTGTLAAIAEWYTTEEPWK